MADIPRDAQSAGFSSVGTKFQLFAGMICWIFAIRLSTKVLQIRGNSFRQASATVKSVQAFAFGLRKCSSFRVDITASTKLASRRAAHISDPGTHKLFIGATLVFVFSIFVSTELFSFCRKSTTAAWAVLDASQNIWVP